MSESDPALRNRLKDLYGPEKLSDNATKYKGFWPKLFSYPLLGNYDDFLGKLETVF